MLYLKEIKVPIPFDQYRIVIRNGKAVQLELNRSYSSETKDSRVTRKTIGQVVPLYTGMMYPNEHYFALIKNNVPEEIRDAFLMKCARQRERAALQKDPEAMMKKVNESINFLKKEGTAHGGGQEKDDDEKIWYIKDEHDLEYALDVFNDLYELTEGYASRYPNVALDPFKVKMFNKILEELKLTLSRSGPIQQLELIPEPRLERDRFGNEYWDGMSYSDLIMLLAWYKNALKD